MSIHLQSSDYIFPACLRDLTYSLWGFPYRLDMDLSCWLTPPIRLSPFDKLRVLSDTRVFPAFSQIQKQPPFVFNIPKQQSYHRTLIVKAAVHQILDPFLVPTLLRKSKEVLNYWHWAGVSPYTSAFALAGTCVFVKQSLNVVSCGPDFRSGQDISKTYVQLFCRVP